MSSILGECEYFDTEKSVFVKVVTQKCYFFDGIETILGFEYWTYTRHSETEEWSLIHRSEWKELQ